MLLFEICHALNYSDTYIQNNPEVRQLDEALNKTYKQIEKNKNIIQSQRVWLIARDQEIQKSEKYKQDTKNIVHMYRERIKHLLLQNNYYKTYIAQNFEKIAAANDLHSTEAIILRYALMIYLGITSFADSSESDGYYRYIWKVHDKEYLLLWTLDGGNKLGSHMFFYITLDKEIEAVSLPFHFHSHKSLIHSFGNNPTFKEGILTIWDNMETQFQYSLQNRELILIQKH